MSTSPTLLSIIIPTYNYAATITRAVNSVIHQLTPHSELIIIDDGSTDDTDNVLSRIIAEHPGLFRIVRKENGGPSSARNRGIQEARGNYLVFLDADDELLPGSLKTLEEHIAAFPGSRLIIGGHISRSPIGLESTHLPRKLPSSAKSRLVGYLLKKKIVLCNGACAMHREIFEQGQYPEQFRSAEDIPVFAQALANHPCSILSTPIALIHKHDDSLRHQLNFAQAGGIGLVDEIFSPQRLGPEFQRLRPDYITQRYLSLFRSAYLAKDVPAAKKYFLSALSEDWRVLFKLSYTKKAFRLWFDTLK